MRILLFVLSCVLLLGISAGSPNGVPSLVSSAQQRINALKQQVVVGANAAIGKVNANIKKAFPPRVPGNPKNETENLVKFDRWVRVNRAKFLSAAARLKAFANFKLNRERIIQLNNRHYAKTGRAVFKSTSRFTTWSQKKLQRLTGTRPLKVAPVPFSRKNKKIKAKTTKPRKTALLELQATQELLQGPVAPSSSTGSAAATNVTMLLDVRNQLGNVRMQGSCGSCWAFSSAQAVEAAWFRKGAKSEALSAQQLVDCDVGNGNTDCSGGNYVNVYQSYWNTKNASTEKEYPYVDEKWDSTSAGQTCKMQKGSGPLVASWDYATPPCNSGECDTQSEVNVLTALRVHGVLNAIVDASNWAGYSGGIMSATACSSAAEKGDHAIVIVGLGKDADGTTFWLIRNSWDTTWGEQGHIRLEYGTNTCGIANFVTYVEV